jgi:hypothetical protein
MLGIDEGMPYRISPIPLTLEGEVHMRQLGFITYGLHSDYFCHRTAGRIQLDLRHPRPPVFATHKCFFDLPVEFIQASAVPLTMKAIEHASLEAETQNEGEPPPEVDVNAMFTIAELLSGKVVAIQGPAPPF